MTGTQRGGTQLALLIGGVLLTGTFGYYTIEEGWSLMDAFYMTVITITTIGYGEVRGLSDHGRIFTVFLITFGLGASALFATHFARLIVENTLKGVWGKRKMEKTIAGLTGHYIICGFGQIGKAICSDLHDKGIPFVVIDRDEESVEMAEQRLYQVLRGNATTDLALLSAGVKRANGIVSALSSDSDNLYISLTARELNPKLYILVRSEGTGVERRMHRAGADVVVSPAKLGGRQIAQMIVEQSGTSPADGEETLSSVLGYHLKVYKNLTGGPVPVAEAVRKSGAVRALAKRLPDGTLIDNPPSDAPLLPEEALVVLLVEGGDAAPSTTEDPAAAGDWDDSLSVGIMSIDEEHQVLLGLIAKLGAASRASEREVIDSVLGELVDYTVRHFRHEEGLLEKHGYPDLEQHLWEHEELSRKVISLQQEKHHLVKENFSSLLNDWLRNHIQGTDKKYSNFLLERGVR